MSGRNVLLCGVGFLLGGAIGFVSGYFLSKNKYLEIADKEIASVKKVYENHFNKHSEVSSSDPVKKIESEQTVNPDKEQYENYAGMYGGGKTVDKPVSTIPTPKKTKPQKHTPHVISPEEYRDSEYPVETLIYYFDKVLADSDGNVIHNVNEVIGPEALSTFGRYEDDAVYVRDDDKRIDYEIIWSNKKFNQNNGQDELNNS